ncbi:hypothetical protein DL767_003781 [Monosporascus sp. MG133]|nr:hypothetical protein DL767_003781 [Monosporascus sp. MG133]
MIGDNLPPETIAVLSLSSKRQQDQLGRRYETLDPEEERCKFLRLLCRNAPFIYYMWKYRKGGRDIAGLVAALERDTEQAGYDPMPWTQNSTWRDARSSTASGSARTITYVRFKHLLGPHPDTGMPQVVFRGAPGIIHEDDVRLWDGSRMLGCVTCNGDVRVDVRNGLPQF